MRSDRNDGGNGLRWAYSLDDWDMRSDRNSCAGDTRTRKSLDDWDMRSDRNPRLKAAPNDWKSR